ncbi:MAG: AAA family ATPase, partial [Candidatus ainarchaeum sp.]|nr:AAA family ATPase [Candidatus ainarchaeum sp.]
MEDKNDFIADIVHDGIQAIAPPKVQPGMIVQVTRTETPSANRSQLSLEAQKRLSDLEIECASLEAKLKFAPFDTEARQRVDEISRGITLIWKQVTSPRTVHYEALVSRVEPHYVESGLFKKKRWIEWRVTLEGWSGFPSSDTKLVPLRWSNAQVTALQDETFRSDKGVLTVLTQNSLEPSSLVFLADAKKQTLYAVPGNRIPDKSGAVRRINPTGSGVELRKTAQLVPKTGEKSVDAGKVEGSKEPSGCVQKNNGKPDTPLVKPNPREIAQILGATVRGQPNATESIAVAICDNQLRPKGVKKSNVIIVGPTGCGKTELGRQASYLMGVPFVETKLTGKSSTGCKGQSLDTFFEDVASHRNEPGFKRSVVLLDEIDKIRPPTNGWDAFESRL